MLAHIDNGADRDQYGSGNQKLLHAHGGQPAWREPNECHGDKYQRQTNTVKSQGPPAWTFKSKVHPTIPNQPTEDRS